MLRIILILLIIIVVYKIYTTHYEHKDTFVNITNPFVDGLSQFQLGADQPDDVSFMEPDTLPDTQPSNKNVLNRINRLATSTKKKKQ